MFNYINMCVPVDTFVAGWKLIQLLSIVKKVWRNKCTSGLDFDASLLFTIDTLNEHQGIDEREESVVKQHN